VVPVLRGKAAAYERHHDRAAAAGRPVVLPTIVLHELWYGVERSAHRHRNRLMLEQYLAGPIESLPFDEDDAPEAARLRALLAQTGAPIGLYDLLIAAQASRRAWTVATGNVRAFSSVPGLAVEDWTV